MFLLIIIFLNFCVVVGFFGNGVVIYIYGLWFYVKNVCCYFILYLVVVDFLVLVILVEFYMVLNFILVIYKFEIFCKWNFVVVLFVIVYLISILLIIVV